MRKIVVNVNLQFEYDDDMFERDQNDDFDDEDVIRKVMYDIQEMVEDGDSSLMDIDISEEEIDE